MGVERGGGGRGVGLRGGMVRKQAVRRVGRVIRGMVCFLKGFDACLDRKSGSRRSVNNR
jgi:hypothetical protein